MTVFHVTCGSKVRRSFMYGIWFSCVWVVSKERNNIIFSQKKIFVRYLEDKVKLLFYWYLKTKFVNLAFGYDGWWLNRFSCLEID